MSRLMLALGLGALAGASAADFTPQPSTFEPQHVATVPKGDAVAAAPGGPLCNICEQLADQALQQLINIILQVRSLRGLGATRTSREKPIAGRAEGPQERVTDRRQGWRSRPRRRAEGDGNG